MAIFGAALFAEVVSYYFTNEGAREIICYVVDDPSKNPRHLNNIAVIGTDEFFQDHSPSSCDVFVAIGYTQMNRIRQKKCDQLHSHGYRFASFVSKHAVVPIDFVIEPNVFIFENNVIQPFVTVGKNSILWSGNHVGHHSTIGENCFISSHCVISSGVAVGDNCFLGVNSTLRDNIIVASHSLIGAGALVLKDIPKEGVCVQHGTPLARISSSRLKL